MLSAVIPSILSYPALQLALQPVHQWYVHPGPRTRDKSSNSSTPMADRDWTVSRRSEPSSRTTLIGEQPNPWDLLQPQDEPTSRCQTPSSIWTLEASAVIPGVPFIRWAMALPLRTTDHYDRLLTLLDLSVSQSGRLMPLTYERFLTVLSLPSHASVTFWEATAPVKLPTIYVL